MARSAQQRRSAQKRRSAEKRRTPERTGERRMVFDVRGRRKHVIRVVYAILAVLMGGSLFLVVGPVNLTELIGRGGSTSPNKALDEQAERIEQRLVRNPNETALLLGLARTRISAGNTLVEVNPESGAPEVTPDARKEYEQGTAAWDRYLKQVKGKASASVATLVAGTGLTLAQSATSYPEAFEHLEEAVGAQKLVAGARPSVGSYTTLAAYQYLAGEFGAAEQAEGKATSLAGSKSQKKQIEKQLAQYQKSGKQIRKGKKEAEKSERKAGKEKLQNPLGGFGNAPVGP
jgi:hypothetical protein